MECPSYLLPQSCHLIRAKFLLTIWCLLLVISYEPVVLAQQAPDQDRWEPAIQQFEQQDQQQTPPEEAILFVGSSTIRRWDTAQSFPELKTLNRGFGGSQIRDATRYFPRIVAKYRPSVIVFYSGDNDLAAGRSVDQAVKDYTEFVRLAEQQLPHTHVVYIPIKPSLARWKLWPAMSEVNQRIADLCNSTDKWHYADTATPMLNSEGSPRPELFVRDGLHLSDEGYALWTELLSRKLTSVVKHTGVDSSSESAQDNDDQPQALPSQEKELGGDWSQSLQFYASFDEGVDADFARGDRRAYTATDISRKEVRPGLHVPQAERVDGGRWGSALRFGAKTDEVLFYHGNDNLPYSPDGFGGTISLWMSLTPDEDLEPGFVDPLQITDKAWNDACFFLDFSKDERPRHFRLGVFSDLAFWNPNDRNWDDIPEPERPMITVKQPPFSRDRWIHVAFTYEKFNSNEDGSATLYLDGQPVGSLRGPQKFSWKPEDVVIMLGIYYSGLLDELAVFDRAFKAEEIQQLANSEKSLKEFAVAASQEIPEYRWEPVNLQAEFAPRDGAGALVFQNKMWLLGGWNPGDKRHFPRICNNEVWSSTDGRQWELVKPNTFLDANFDPRSDWEGRHTAGYAVHDDKMWIIGGDVNQGHYQNDVWNSTNGRDWTLVNPDQPVPWSPRALHYTVAFQNQLWVIGGQSMPGFAPAEEKFHRDIWTSSDGKNWKQILPQEPAWSPRGMIGGHAVYRDRIWILGGGTYDTPNTPTRQFFNDVWSSEDGVTWKQHTAAAPWAPRQYHEVAVFDDRLWVMEGYGGANRNDVWHSADGVHWHELPDTPWKPRHAASVFVHDNSLWMVAGNNMESDVWRLSRVR